MAILNLAQHKASKEQLETGLVDLGSDGRDYLSELLTIKWGDDINEKVKKIVKLASGYKFVMIGGAPYLMPLLERALLADGVTVLYAFSNRVSEEFTNDKGEVEKKMCFKHKGFYSAEDGFDGGF